VPDRAGEPEELDFFESPEAAALSQIPGEDREAVLERFVTALWSEDLFQPRKLDGELLHELVGHGLPDRFEPRDPLARHVGPVLRAYLAFLARTGPVPHAAELGIALDAALPEFERAVRTGEIRHHHAHAEPYVRAAPRVGRNEPCPCGSGRKFKRCCGTP
jgi:hypothetical protein